MDFRVLGPLEVAVDGRPLALGGRRQRMVLALLLLHADEAVSSERLIDSLWPDQRPHSAANTLQQYVSRLRRALGQAVVVTTSSGYVLHPSPGELDVRRFESLISQTPRRDPARASEHLRAALGLWRGPAFPDLDENPEAGAEIRRLEELRLLALEERTEADLAVGRARTLIPELESLVARHPLRERLRGQLMLALYRAGRQADSLAAYAQARQTLVDELGIEPERKLRELQQAILQQDPTLDLDTPAETVAASGVPVFEQRRLVTCAVCDLSSLSLKAEYGDPDLLGVVVSRCFARSKAVAEEHGGTFRQFSADAALLVFGMPVVHEDDALRAVTAALVLRAALSGLEVEARIGVSTGEVVTDASQLRVVGQAASLAAELGRAAEPGEVLIAETTLSVLGDKVAVEPIDTGQHRPAAWRLLSLVVGARASTSAFVGRQAELAALVDSWEQVCREQRCDLLTVIGVPGVGKSRLVAEFLPSAGGTVVRGRCPPYGEGVTYWPVLEVLRELRETIDEVDLPAPARAVLGDLLEGRETAPTNEIAWSVRTLLEAVSKLKPLMVVLDDLQWGEQVFLDLVEELPLMAADVPLFVCCMSRPELLDHRPVWGRLLRLEPLDEREATELITDLVAERWASAELRKRILEAAAGNPLFIEEMAGVLSEARGDEVVVPPTIQALMTARVDQLDPDERALLQRGSIEGEVFHRGVVQALIEDEPRLTAPLTALVRKDFLRAARPQLLGEEAFRFRHLLIRDAAYGTLPKAARADLHERLAGWFEQHGSSLAELDEILGYHLEQAHQYAEELALDREATSGLARRGHEHLTNAGRRASARGDFSAASSLIRRALALLSQDDFAPELEFELADALFFAGQLNSADTLLRALAQRSNSVGERRIELRARIYQAITMYYLDPQGRLEELRVRAEEGLPAFERAHDDAGLFASLLALGHVEHARGRHESKRALSERAFACARRLGNETRVKIITRYLIDSRLAGPTPVAETLRWLDEMEHAGMEHPGFVVARAGGLAMLGHFDEARHILELSRTQLAARGAGVQLAEALLSQSMIELLSGDASSAETSARESWLIWEEMRNRTWLATAAAQLARALYAVGRLDEAKRASEAVRELSVSDDVEMQSFWRHLQAKLAARRGDHALAEGLAAEAVRLLEPTDALPAQAEAMLDRAETTNLLGRNARPEFERALRLFERKGNVVMVDRLRTQLKNYPDVLFAPVP